MVLNYTTKGTVLCLALFKLAFEPWHNVLFWCKILLIMTIYVVGRYTLKNEGTIILIKLQIMINFLRVEQSSYKKLPPNLNRITSFDLSDNDFVTWFSLERFANATVKIYHFSQSTCVAQSSPTERPQGVLQIFFGNNTFSSPDIGNQTSIC